MVFHCTQFLAGSPYGQAAKELLASLKDKPKHFGVEFLGKPGMRTDAGTIVKEVAFEIGFVQIGFDSPSRNDLSARLAEFA